ncbi:hypothetical protein H4W29_001300 [Rhizobium viscosum]|uniref:Uncharacterized protein n=2 Tax=Rhizobium viscosum TaxID=1673 RepID=A0ABR9ILS1_RHIVS|nr:hypothetical protein [Rhizobium viscosum]
MMKKFRKAIGAKDEVKGGLLDDAQRGKFFDMLGEEEHFSAVVTCHKSSSLGSVVSNVHPECSVLEQMVIEACMPLMVSGTQARIIADGGRYSRQVYDQIAAKIAATIGKFNAAPAIDFVRSDITAGVQIADIIANTIYKATRDHHANVAETSICSDLIRGGRLLVFSAKLDVLKPRWLATG